MNRGEEQEKMEEHVPETEKKQGSSETSEKTESKTDVKAWILLILLTVYVILLGIGTVAEVFDIEWILKWPIY